MRVNILTKMYDNLDIIERVYWDAYESMIRNKQTPSISLYMKNLKKAQNKSVVLQGMESFTDEDVVHHYFDQLHRRFSAVANTAQPVQPIKQKSDTHASALGKRSRRKSSPKKSSTSYHDSRLVSSF